MKKALLIGINYIGTDYELRGCINDVVNMKNYIKSQYNLQDSDITMMTELANEERLQPTKANMLREIDALVSGATHGTTLFFHYSGHGGSVRDRNADETDRLDETIYPLDGEIVDDELKRHLIDPLPEGARLTALSDSCHSGTLCDLKYNLRVTATGGRISTTLVKDKKYADTKAIVHFFSGCADDQLSADAYEEGSSQGAMTFAFLKTLKKYASAASTSKPVLLSSFMRSMCTFLISKGYDQVPQLSSGKVLNANDAMLPLF